METFYHFIYQRSCYSLLSPDSIENCLLLRNWFWGIPFFWISSFCTVCMSRDFRFFCLQKFKHSLFDFLSDHPWSFPSCCVSLCYSTSDWKVITWPYRIPSNLCDSTALTQFVEASPLFPVGRQSSCVVHVWRPLPVVHVLQVHHQLVVLGLVWSENHKTKMDD